MLCCNVWRKSPTFPSKQKCVIVLTVEINESTFEAKCVKKAEDGVTSSSRDLRA